MRPFIDALAAPPNLLLELDRTTLPLRKGVIANARGIYGALVAVMHPMQFLQLTTVEGDMERLRDGPGWSNEPYVKRLADHSGKPFELPFLSVELPGGRVTGHEGRHRAILVLDSGGDRFPVLLYFRSPVLTVVTWEQSPIGGGEDDYTDMQQSFATIDAARAFADDLETRYKDDAETQFYHRIRVRQQGGVTHRGAPNRSDPEQWVYAAWRKSDMPPLLIGQYDPSVHIPTSSMKIGLVKGYRHHKR